MWLFGYQTHFSSVKVHSDVFEKDKKHLWKARIYFGNPAREVEDCFISFEKNNRMMTDVSVYTACYDTCSVEWILDTSVVEKIQLLELIDGTKIVDLLVLYDGKKKWYGPPKGNHWEIDLDSLKRIEK